MTAAQTVIFLHIPKTGGTTFSKILERYFAPEESLTLDGGDHRAAIQRFIASDEAERGRYRLIQGHLHFGLHDFVPGASSYVTFLRDPIARALSLYSYARTQPRHYLYRAIVEERLDLTELLNRKATPELFNHQTRMIAGNLTDLKTPIDRSGLECAKRNLRENFSFVGVTEEFDAGLLLLVRMFDWRMPIYRKRNVTSGLENKNVDVTTRGLLAEANSLDLELHQFARELFGARRRATGREFETELRRFQQFNAIGGGAHQNYRKAKTAVRRLINGRGNSKPAAILKESPAMPSI